MSEVDIGVATSAVFDQSATEHEPLAICAANPAQYPRNCLRMWSVEIAGASELRPARGGCTRARL